jgi:hypothetical protein
MKALSPKHREKINKLRVSSNGGFFTDNGSIAFDEHEKHRGGGKPKKKK